MSLYQKTKRGMDILGSLLGLLIFSILYIPIGLLIKLDSKGPILVSLKRVSEGKEINLYKFRSMKKGSHKLKKNLAHLNERKDGPFFKMTNDPRVTKIGKVIRRFRLDEVPQFINVFKGELSLVGPRPHEKVEIKEYPKEFKFLTKHKAGITGLSQVSGASSLAYLKELEIDSHYLKKQNLWLDLKIILKTISIMLFDPTAV